MTPRISSILIDGVRVMDRMNVGEDLLDSVNKLDMITDELEKTVDLWIKGSLGTDVLNEIIESEVLDDLDYELEISVNTSCCCDEFFDNKLDEWFCDDDDIHKYLNEDSSELLSAMIASFSRVFPSFLCWRNWECTPMQ